MTPDTAARVVDIAYHVARRRLVEHHGEGSKEVRAWDDAIEMGLFREAVGAILHATGGE